MSGVDGSMPCMHGSIGVVDDSIVIVRGCNHASDASNAWTCGSKATKKPPKGGFDVLRENLLPPGRIADSLDGSRFVTEHTTMLERAGAWLKNHSCSDWDAQWIFNLDGRYPGSILRRGVRQDPGCGGTEIQGSSRKHISGIHEGSGEDV
jgi:hypothetical protein